MFETFSIMMKIDRYGGQYSDLDTVTMRNTQYLENVLSVAGDFISNANLFFSPSHPFLLELMKEADKKFTGSGWNSLGCMKYNESRKYLNYSLSFRKWCINNISISNMKFKHYFNY